MLLLVFGAAGGGSTIVNAGCAGAGDGATVGDGGVPADFTVISVGGGGVLLLLLLLLVLTFVNCGHLKILLLLPDLKIW